MKTHKYKIGMNPNSRNGFKKGHKTFLTKKHYKELGLKLTGRKHTEEAKKKISLNHNYQCSRGMLGKKQSVKKIEMMKGNKYAWKGGERQDRRNDPAYHIWVKKVRERDNYKCKINNCDCKGRLVAHHILPWRDYPELRYDVNNGIMLCQAHHPRKWAEEKRLSPYFMELVSVSNKIT